MCTFSLILREFEAPEFAFKCIHGAPIPLEGDKSDTVVSLFIEVFPEPFVLRSATRRVSVDLKVPQPWFVEGGPFLASQWVKCTDDCAVLASLMFPVFEEPLKTLLAIFLLRGDRFKFTENDGHVVNNFGKKDLTERAVGVRSRVGSLTFPRLAECLHFLAELEGAGMNFQDKRVHGLFFTLVL